MARVLAYNARPFLLTATTVLVIGFGCSRDQESAASDGAAGESIAGTAPDSPVSTAGGNDAGASGAASEGFAAGGQPGLGQMSAGGDSAGADGAAGSSGAAGMANGGAATGVGGSNIAGGIAGGGGMAGSSGSGGVAGTGGFAGSSGGAFPGTLPCEVRTVLSARCTTCHSSPPNNGAPMSLVSWDSVSAYAAAINGAVSSGAMPPTGSLSTNEASILLSYVSSGAPSAANVTCP